MCPVRPAGKIRRANRERHTGLHTLRLGFLPLFIPGLKFLEEPSPRNNITALGMT